MPEENNIEVKIGKLETKVDFVLQEIKSLRDGTYSDIAMLKQTKADRAEIDKVQKKIDEDIEKRMRTCEERIIDPSEHKSLLATTNRLEIYLILGIVLITILVGIMSVHILGIRLP